MKSALAAALLVLSLGVAASHAGDLLTVDLWPGGKPPSQTVEPGPDTVNKSRGGKVRLTNITRPQLKIYLPDKEKNTGTALLIAPGGHAFGGDLMNPPVLLVGDWSHRLEAWLRYQKILEPKRAS